MDEMKCKFSIEESVKFLFKCKLPNLGYVANESAHIRIQQSVVVLARDEGLRQDVTVEQVELENVRPE